MSDERRPGIHVDEENLDQGFKIGNTTFRVTCEMDGPVWRFSPNDIVHSKSTLTRNVILQQIEKAAGRPLEVLAAPDLAGDLLIATREVLAEAIRRGWIVEPRAGEAITFDPEHGHVIDGLTGEEAGVLQNVLDEIRDEPGGAVITLGVKEKDQHRLFVEAISDGALPIYLRPDDAAKAIRRMGDGRAVLAFGRMPNPAVSDTLAARIDAAIQAAAPQVSFQGPATLSVVESGRGVMAADIEQPKTPEEDVLGKVRVALSAAKLIEANQHFVNETPHGEPDLPGWPSRQNSLLVVKLEEALMWAERDAEAKGRPRG